MVNNNDLINLVNNKKPVELVQELKDYEIKKSSLSKAARGKVINKSGSGYVSKGKESYGPVGEYWREWTDEDGNHNIGCGQVVQTSGVSRRDGRSCTCDASSR